MNTGLDLPEKSHPANLLYLVIFTNLNGFLTYFLLMTDREFIIVLERGTLKRSTISKIFHNRLLACKF